MAHRYFHLPMKPQYLEHALMSFTVSSNSCEAEYQIPVHTASCPITRDSAQLSLMMFHHVSVPSNKRREKNTTENNINSDLLIILREYL